MIQWLRQIYYQWKLRRMVESHGADGFESALEDAGYTKISDRGGKRVYKRDGSTFTITEEKAS